MAADPLVELAERLQARCTALDLTVATAESCTGGLVAHALTEVPGSSAYVRGGIVAYANEVKTALLGVPAEVLEAHGAVSAQVAVAMAEGARERLGTDLGVGVTGVAGPDGGTEEKPVGLVYFHVSTPDTERGGEFSLPADRDTVRSRATVGALHLARRVLTQSRHEDV